MLPPYLLQIYKLKVKLQKPSAKIKKLEFTFGDITMDLQSKALDILMFQGVPLTVFLQIFLEKD